MRKSKAMKTKWQIKKLGQVSRVGAGNSAPQDKSLFDKGKFPFFRTSDVGLVHMGSLSKSADYLNEKGSKGLRVFPKNTILMPKSGASTFLNHRVVMDVSGYVSSHLATINTNESILDTKYLFYFLQEVRSQDLIQDHKYPSLNLPVIEDIDVPVPPLSEQKRIAKTLDDVFEKLTKAKENAEKNLQNSKELFESYLNNVFANPGRNWGVKRLEEISIKITDGVHKKPKYVPEGIPFIKINNLTEGPGISFKGVSYITVEDHEEFCKRTKPEKGDILITKDGTIGVVRIIETDLKFSIFVSVALIKPISKNISQYLAYVLMSPIIQNQIKPRGAALKHLYLKDLRQFNIPIAPFGQQKAIVKKLDALSVETKKLEKIYERKLADLEELKKSVLRKAFTGDL